jgi:gas vesicle protein
MNKILIAFTSGIVLGILFAPAKGKKTRKKIANLGNDCKNGWNTLTDKLAGKIDTVRDGVDNMAYTAVEKIEDLQFDTPERTI